MAFRLAQGRHSLVQAAATLAVSFVPAVASAPLGSLADRFPRRSVMIVCDLARAAVIALLAFLAVSGTPIPLATAKAVTIQVELSLLTPR